jgi:hypothetical protein
MIDCAGRDGNLDGKNGRYEKYGRDGQYGRDEMEAGVAGVKRVAFFGQFQI